MEGDTSIGRIVRTRRRTLDLTQADLAQRVGYSVITIRKVEADERRPSLELAERLAQSLGLAVEERRAFVWLARNDATKRPRPYAWHRLGGAHRATGPATNLSTPPTRLIGRDDAVNAVCASLTDADSRLLTLVGPPGIGKTRLAMQVGREIRNAFADGVFVAALAPLRDPGLIASAVATAVGATDLDAAHLVDSLIAHLRERRLLLLLDNFEHLLPGAPVVATILAACPGVRVLATSRAPLHLNGERLFVVPPLTVPSLDRIGAAGPVRLTAAAAAASSAVQLFVERARAAKPDFTLTDDNAADVAAICTRVDGVPLAIELVAARTRMLAPAILLSRLDRRLSLLTDGPRDLPERQQTLRAALDWSYDLLEPAEQELFARLSVFPGGATIDAAEHVIAGREQAGLGALDGLAALVDKNLLHEQTRAGQPYFMMLQTVREYALDRLAASGEQEQVRQTCADYFLNLAEAARPELSGAQQEKWFARFDAECDNLRAALEWYASQRMTEPAHRFVAALWPYWHVRADQTEALHWIRLVLALDPPNPRVRAEVLFGAGWIALDHDDVAWSGALFRESLHLFREAGDQSGIAQALHGVATIAQAEGREQEAADLLRESLALHREIGSEEGIAWALDHLGLQALNQQEYDRAEELFTEGLSLFRQRDHAWGTALVLHHLGVAALMRGNSNRATVHLQQALASFSDLHNRCGLATTLTQLGLAALSRGDHAEALANLTRAVELILASEDGYGLAGALCGLASLARAQGDLIGAASALGFLDEAIGSGQMRLNPYERSILDRDVAAITMATRDDENVRRAFAAGPTTPWKELAADLLARAASPA